MVLLKSMALTHKQQLFVIEYVKCWNATEAAKKAGYSPNGSSHQQIGFENLLKPVIKEAIDLKLKESAMSADEVLSRLARIARGNIANIVKANSATDIENLDTDVSLTIKKFKRHVTSDLEGKVTEHIEIELYSAHDALRDLGKRHSLFTDKVEHSGNIEQTLVILPAKEE